MPIFFRFFIISLCGILPVGAFAELCQGLVTDKSHRPRQALPKPGYLEAFTDPQFGTTIRRISDVEKTASGRAAVIKPMYSTVPAWNTDESLLIIWQRKKGHLLLDGKSYQFIKKLKIRPSDLEHVYWHATNPDVLFYPESRKQGSQLINRLTQYNVKTDRYSVIKDFTEEGIGGYKFGFGGDPMYSSWDSDYFGFSAPEKDRQYFTFRLSDQTIGGRIKVKKRAPAPAPSPNGKLFLHRGVVYDFNLNKVVHLGLNKHGEHASIGQLRNGEQKLFHVTFDRGKNDAVGSVVMHDLQTGHYKVLVGPRNGYPYPPSGTHMSALALKQPGWVAVSMVGKGKGDRLLDNELLLVNANPGEEEVCRIGHHWSMGREGPRKYWAEPHVVISPTATRVLFASDWGGGESVDTYVVELPSYNAEESS